MSSDAAERVASFVEAIADELELDGAIEVSEDDEQITVSVGGEDVGLLIGHHGQTIDAVQHMAYRVAMRGGASGKRVIVDAGGYRARRAAALERMADEAADDAVRNGRAVSLDAMTASERRHMHEYLRERGDVETHSEGNEPQRHLVVSPLG